jgi:hypothetical protein
VWLVKLSLVRRRPARHSAGSGALGPTITVGPVIVSRWRVVCAGLVAAIVVVAGLIVLLIRREVVDVAPAPPPASDLTADATADAVRLSWQPAPGDVGRYGLTRDGTTLYIGRETGYVDRTVGAGGTYGYTVVAVSPAGARSTAVSIVVRVPALSRLLPPPGPVLAAAGASRSVELSWSATSGRTGVVYVVLRDGTKVGGSASPRYTDTAVRAGATYTYTVRTFDPAWREESVDSAPVTVRTPAEELGTAHPPAPVAAGPANTAAFTGLADGAPVGRCQRLTGTADLAPDRTLLLASRRTGPPDNRFTLLYVFPYQGGHVPPQWSGYTYFGTTIGSTYDLYLLVMEVGAAQAFTDALPPDGATALPPGAVVADVVPVTQTSLAAC